MRTSPSHYPASLPLVISRLWPLGRAQGVRGGFFEAERLRVVGKRAEKGLLARGVEAGQCFLQT